MKQLMLGVLLGSVLTGSLGLAQNLYDRNGQPAAPRGSIQQYDYFRQRQQFLDVQALRQQAEQERANRAGRIPCGR